MAYKIVGVEDDNTFPPRVEGHIDDKIDDKIDAASVNYADVSIETTVTTGRLSQTSLDNRYATNTALNSTNSDVTAVENSVSQLDTEVNNLDSVTVKKGTLLLNVKDYGAIGNGTANDTASLQAAFNAVPSQGATVLFPPGNYNVHARVSIKANTKIEGYGATIHRVASGSGTLFINWVGNPSTTAYNGNGNITLLGLTFDGHVEQALDSNPLWFAHARDITVRDCRFIRIGEFHAVELLAIDGALVDNCRFEGYSPTASVAREAVQLDCAMTTDGGQADNTMTKNVTVSNCYFGPYGAIGSPNSAVGSHNTPNSTSFYTNIKVIGCTMEGVGSGEGIGVRAEAWDESVISDNVLIGTEGRSIQVNNNSRNVVVKGNVIESANGEIGIAISNAFDCTVIGNKVYGGAIGVLVEALAGRTLVSSNTVKRTSSYAINFDGSRDAVAVSNLIIEPGWDGASGTGSSAIRISATSGVPDRNSVMSNRVAVGSLTTPPAVGASVIGSATDTLVFGNDFLGCAAATSGTVSTTNNRI